MSEPKQGKELIEEIFASFEVGGKAIPVAFAHYEGHGEPYVVYAQTDADASLFGDDALVGYVEYYDFDVYARTSYSAILTELRTKLESNGFVWQPSRSSGDLWEPDSGYYHKTMTFAVLKGE